MKELIYKAAAFGASASLFLASAAPAAATNYFTSSGNGASSDQDFNFTINVSETDSQSNSGETVTIVTNLAETGDNIADENTGGDVYVYTGMATANATVDNGGDTNEITDSCGCLADDYDVLFEGNGESSDNTATISDTRTRVRAQTNSRNRTTTVDNQGRTGGNRARRNTGGVTDVNTSDASATTDVTNDGDTNTIE